MKKILAILLLFTMSFACFSGCAKNQKSTINLKIWHVYGGQTDSPLNNLIKEFNKTVGKENGIQIDVTMVSNTSKIHKDVIASANNDPGTSPLPDIFCAYPKTVLALPDSDILVNFEDYFSKDELNKFVPEFLNEGKVEGHIKVLPVAKSSEMLYVNKTLFDQYSISDNLDAKGDDVVLLDNLKTWEGIFKTTEKYAKFTDLEKSPDVPNDSKAFFVHDYLFHYFQVGMQSLGKQFFENDKINFDENFKNMFNPLASSSIEGGVWLKNNFATEPLRTGDAIAVVASSASILYFSNKITNSDNIDKLVEIQAMPAPYFEKGKKLAVQRGSGMCVLKSTREREEAAITFLKWLTEPQRNTLFVTQTGYMPVTNEAFEVCMPKRLASLENDFEKDPESQLKCKMYKSVYTALYETYKNYEFFVPPQFESYLDIEDEFEKNIRMVLSESRKKYISPDNKDDKSIIIERAFEDFKNSLLTQQKGR